MFLGVCGGRCVERTDQEEALPSCVELGGRLRVTVTLKLVGSEGNFLSHLCVPVRLVPTLQ